LGLFTTDVVRFDFDFGLVVGMLRLQLVSYGSET